MSEKFGREFMGTVLVKGGVLAIMDPTRRGGVAALEATQKAQANVDGYAEWQGAVGFMTAWKDGGYNVFCYRNDDNQITSVELVLKDD